MYEWFAYLSVRAPYAYSSHKGQKSVLEPPGIVTDDCEPATKWELGAKPRSSAK